MNEPLDSRSAFGIISRLMELADEKGVSVAAAVCDGHGELLAFSRSDGCAPVSGKVASAKAFTAARLRKSTRAYKEEGFGLENLADGGYTQYPGGFPLFDGGRCIGGVGVSGLAPEEDEVLVIKVLEEVYSSGESVIS